ncbi:RNA-dependent RNA polymerase P3a [Raspberry latent virus]|uniref:RNA-dependent RNA polymerase P3a n=1 Tax=Raspberry latent virus TaxID=907191 RepID=UPI0001E69019|nr:RNA-dependent RNA polymerase P3a [Raspberry latent virus]ADO27688.1 RNA-dependent RNA polymerase P3a [Raspberry latent virus]
MFPTIVDILTNLTYKPELHHDYLSELKIIDDPQKIYDYLRLGEPLRTGELITGIATGGFEFSFRFTLPTEITNPPPFDVDTYKAAVTSDGFSDPTQPNYLVTCDIRSIFDQLDKFTKKEEIPVGLQVVRHMITRSVYQSRISSIWRQLLSVKLACEARAGARESKDPISRCIATLLERHLHPPFWESKKEVHWLKIKTLSILPLLLHAVANLGTQLLVDNLTEMEVLLCFQIYLQMARRQYQDTKLSMQKKIRSWLREGLQSLGVVKVPRWSPGGMLAETRMYMTREYPSTQEAMDKARKTREEILLPLINQYIRECLLRVRDVQLMLNSWIVTRIMSNDGTYFASQPALTLDKAVKPKLCSTITPALRPVIMLGDSITLEADPIPNSPFARAISFTDRYVETTVQRLQGTNWEESFIQFLTSSSSGRDFQPEILISYSQVVQKVIRSRVFAAGIESETYYSLEDLEHLARQPSKLVGRDQISRRQRAVAGVNNGGTLLGFPALRILEAMLKQTKHASSGKQTGTFLDLLKPLSCFSSDYFCFNSSDVEGMDASVQANVQQMMWNFVLRVASKLPRTKYFAYNYGETQVTKYEYAPNGVVPINVFHMLKQVTGLELACARASTSLQPQNCQIKDDILGIISTREPTFPSGLPFTGAHHSFTLISAAQADKWMEERAGGYSSTQIFHEVQGDDELFIYHGLEKQVEGDIVKDMNATRRWGFSVDPETSKNTCEFLQQRVALGRFIGYPDRVSLFTAERPREGKSIKEKMSEIVGLGTDLGPRSRNPQGLVRLYYAIGICCTSRITFKVSTENAKKMVASSFGKDCGANLYERTVVGDKPSPFEYVRMYYPICALWHEDGGGLAPLRCFRKDGSCTVFPSYYFMRGDLNRRWLWDISNNLAQWKEHAEICKVDNIHGVSPGRYLDCALIERFLWPQANHLVITSKAQIVEDFRTSDLFTMDSINRLARKVDSMRDSKKIDSSILAQAKLAEKGFDIPDGIVTGHQIRSRMLDSVQKAELTESEDVQIGDMYVDKLLRFKPRIQIKKTDVCMLYYLTENKDDPIPTSEFHRVIDQVSLSLEVTPYSDAATLLKYCGIRASHYTKLSVFGEGIQGRYGKGRMNQKIFDIGYNIARKNASMLPTFYNAVGIPQRQRPEFEEALRMYQEYQCLQFKVIRTPRQFFFCDDSGERLLNSCNIIHHQSSNPAVLALGKTILIAELAARASSLCGKRVTLTMVGSKLS